MNTPKAVLVMLDGLRPDAIDACQAPTLQSLAARGASTLVAQSVVPSITLPCHMSIFHSIPPERHNVLSNIFVPMARPIPGLFETIHAAKKKSVMFYSWEVLRDVARPLCLHKSVCIAYDNNPHISDHKTLEAALPTLRDKDFDFCFLYFGSIDEVGHLAGWMSAAYLQQVEMVDTLLATALEAIGPEALVVVQSDHGGHLRFHGSKNPEDMTIPFFMFGPGVPPATPLRQPIGLLNVAPTIAKHLQLEVPALWEGTAIEFEKVEG